jgi:Predicted phosphosugar isomerases
MTETYMHQEVLEIPDAVRRILSSGQAGAEAYARDFLARKPGLIATIGRGSSDHAAYFLKYAFEIELGIPVVSLGPSLASLYGVNPKLAGDAAIAISQSGKSPDIVALAKSVREAGALTISLVNTVPSPLSETSDHAIDLKAGPERSVAATKSYVNSVVAGLMLLAEIKQDDGLRAALSALPGHLADALSKDWTALSDHLVGRKSMFVLGRGPTLAIASEAALKMKETCSVHAEAYSAAEVLHGPVELVEPGYPVLVFNGGGKPEPATTAVARDIAARGGSVFMTGVEAAGITTLPVASAGHQLTDALVQIASYYVFVEAHARRLGRNPDMPRQLKKVTETM